eukprot:Rmarinus@m.29851
MWLFLLLFFAVVSCDRLWVNRDDVTHSLFVPYCDDEPEPEPLLNLLESSRDFLTFPVRVCNNSYQLQDDLKSGRQQPSLWKGNSLLRFARQWKNSVVRSDRPHVLMWAFPPDEFSLDSIEAHLPFFYVDGKFEIGYRSLSNSYFVANLQNEKCLNSLEAWLQQGRKIVLSPPRKSIHTKNPPRLLGSIDPFPMVFPLCALDDETLNLFELLSNWIDGLQIEVGASEEFATYLRTLVSCASKSDRERAVEFILPAILSSSCSGDVNPHPMFSQPTGLPLDLRMKYAKQTLKEGHTTEALDLVLGQPEHKVVCEVMFESTVHIAGINQCLVAFERTGMNDAGVLLRVYIKLIMNGNAREAMSLLEGAKMTPNFRQRFSGLAPPAVREVGEWRRSPLSFSVIEELRLRGVPLMLRNQHNQADPSFRYWDTCRDLPARYAAFAAHVGTSSTVVRGTLVYDFLQVNTIADFDTWLTQAIAQTCGDDCRYVFLANSLQQIRYMKILNFSWLPHRFRCVPVLHPKEDFSIPALYSATRLPLGLALGLVDGCSQYVLFPTAQDMALDGGVCEVWMSFADDVGAQYLYGETPEGDRRLLLLSRALLLATDEYLTLNPDIPGITLPNPWYSSWIILETFSLFNLGGLTSRRSRLSTD